MKKNLFLSMFIFCVMQLAAQEHTVQINAFYNSYNLEATGNYLGAAKEIENLNTKGYEAYYRLGYLYYLQKQYPQSVNAYRKAISVQKTTIEARTALVKTLSAMENYEEVLKVYQEILTIDPQHSTSNYWIAVTYFYKKEYNKSSEHLDRILKNYPFDYDANLLQAQVMLARGKMIEAKQFYQKAHLYNPSNKEIEKIIEKL